MFILKLFWNVLATMLLIIILVLAGFGAYTLYDNNVNDSVETETKSSVLVINNELEDNNNF